MIELNLKTNSAAEQRIKEYLEQNVSEVLAEKINNGVKIEKDGKTLISKKTLDGFMQYATEEARKVAEKGARSACIEDGVVFGWAIHYFEEDSIIGTLYNEDGTECAKQPPKQKPEKPKEEKPKPEKTASTAPEQTTSKPQKTTSSKYANQISMFDFDAL